MSHTSQRRGVTAATKNRELIVLAMVPTKYKDMRGIKGAMKDVGMKMLGHGPENWISRNFTSTAIPRLGKAQDAINALGHVWPAAARDLFMMIAGYVSSVITAVYTDEGKVAGLIKDLRGEWLSGNHEKGFPISVVIAGIPGDIHRCCRANGLTEHTYLHSIGFYGRVKDLPSEEELSLITMCGHGLIASNRIRHLLGMIRKGEITQREAAEDIARPCLCGIVNPRRAEDIFARLAKI